MFKDYLIDGSINIVHGIDNINCKVYDNYKNILVEFEEPNFLNQRNLDEYVELTSKFSLKLTICPYTARLFNNLIGKDICKQCFFPINIDYVVNRIGSPSFSNKTNNVLYIGTNVNEFINQLYSRSTFKSPITDYIYKYEILYKTKILICHNLLFFQNNMQIYNKIVSLMPELNDNRLIMPQLKSRTFEAGFSLCIPLVYYEDTKLIEDFFTPDVDFIYFYNIEDLDNKIKTILENYEDYRYIANNCYNKCINNYTVKNFIGRYMI
jgi:hypothetical protein